MLKVNEIRVDLTRSAGENKFEFDKIGLTAIPDEGSCIAECIHEMKRLILTDIPNPAVTGTKTVKEEVKAPTESSKSSTVKDRASKNQKVDKGEGQVSETQDPGPSKTFETEEEAKAEVEKAKKDLEKKEKKTKVKGKPTAYDRTLETHKKLLTDFLNTAKPGWNLPERIKKAGDASKALNGTDFQDSEGEILESFKTAFLAYL